MRVLEIMVRVTENQITLHPILILTQLLKAVQTKVRLPTEVVLIMDLTIINRQMEIMVMVMCLGIMAGMALIAVLQTLMEVRQRRQLRRKAAHLETLVQQADQERQEMVRQLIAAQEARVAKEPEGRQAQVRERMVPAQELLTHRQIQIILQQKKEKDQLTSQQEQLIQ